MQVKKLDNKKRELEKLFQKEFFDKNKNLISSEHEIIDSYPLYAPFSYANILYDASNSSYLYQVDEIKLNSEENTIFEQLFNLVEQSLESDKAAKKNKDFTSFLNKILDENKQLFNNYPFASIEKVKYYIERDVSGFGIIDPLMHDPNIEDVSCSGIGIPIYIWHRKYDSLPTNIQFENEKLNTFVSRIVFRAGKHVSSAHPISDLALEGGHRISVLYEKEVTPKGTSFTIRKFREDPYTIIDLIDFDTLDPEIAAYLWMLVESKMSLIIIGSTGSGKTTLLNAIAGLVNPDYKIFSVEDVAEININHENWFSLVSRVGFGSAGEGEIGLYELIKSGVRHRPDYVVVGEIRGSEAYVMFQAMATGHGGLCTMHADSLDSAVKRLQQKPMDIPPAYMSLMNCAVVIRRIHDTTTGKSYRRVVSLEEISSTNSYHNIFKWIPKTSSFESNLKESVMLQRLAEQTGQNYETILEEWTRRCQVLRWMTEQGIRDYKEVGKMIRKYYREPRSIMTKIEYGV